MEPPTLNLTCPVCNVTPRKHGKDAKGNQRFQCPKCLKTVTDIPAGPLGHMRLPLDKAVLCLQLIVEGNSLRSTTRIARVNLRTVIDLSSIDNDPFPIRRGAASQRERWGLAFGASAGVRL